MSKLGFGLFPRSIQHTLNLYPLTSQISKYKGKFGTPLTSCGGMPLGYAEYFLVDFGVCMRIADLRHPA